LRVSRWIVALNNWWVRRRARQVEPGELLLLLPSCLQRSGCERRVRVNVRECERCGRCQVGELLEEADRLGVRVWVATGGELALEQARADGVRAVVAVACPKELRTGILRTWPKPVLAVENERPYGPCRDTRVDVEAVREALRFFLGVGGTVRRSEKEGG